MLDEFFREVNVPPYEFAEEGPGVYVPRVDVTEDDKGIKITAELAGMEEKDINVSVCRDAVTISGEKREEKEEQDKGYYRMERRYGSVRRTVALPFEVEIDKAQATFKNGVLTIDLPKSAESRGSAKTIEIKKA
ncbi:MAG TPA: Hsp20/alpha crystallin family protein [Candidatus Obscuribacterales bacterium]